MGYISEADNIIWSEAPMTAGPNYTDPIEIGGRSFLGLSVNFVKGSLSNATITCEAWDGAAWRSIKAADGVTAWQLFKNRDFVGAVHVGSVRPDTELNSGLIMWPRIRFKILCSGTPTGSSIELRLASK